MGHIKKKQLENKNKEQKKTHAFKTRIIIKRHLSFNFTFFLSSHHNMHQICLESDQKTQTNDKYYDTKII